MFSSRRTMVQGCVAIAAVVAMSSAAFACTVYTGKMTITATGPLSSQPAPPANTAFAEGAPGAHQYCTGSTRQNVRIVGTFNLDIGPNTTAGCSAALLPADTYDVRVIPLAISNSAEGVIANCYVDKTQPIQKVGEIVVNGSGVGSGTGYPMPNVLGPVNVCASPTELQVNLSLGGSGAASAPELYLFLV